MLLPQNLNFEFWIANKWQGVRMWIASKNKDIISSPPAPADAKLVSYAPGVFLSPSLKEWNGRHHDGKTAALRIRWGTLLYYRGLTLFFAVFFWTSRPSVLRSHTSFGYLNTNSFVQTLLQPTFLTVCGIHFDLKVTRLEPHFSKYHLKKLCPSFATCRFFQAESMTVFLHKPAMISPWQNERRERNCKHPVLFVFTDGIDQPWNIIHNDLYYTMSTLQQLIELVVSDHLNTISQLGSFPRVRVKMENTWNHHLVITFP